MAITSEHIRTVLNDYLADHPQDKADLAPVLELLDTRADIASRKEWRGHATAGAILTDPAGRVLHIHHLALNRWLLPGGHLEPGDVTLQGAALRELAEETGIRPEDVVPLGDGPLHIDVHPIPANDAKGEPAHQHVDFRYAFHTGVGAVTLQVEEVTDSAWRDASGIADATLRARLVAALA